MDQAKRVLLCNRPHEKSNDPRKRLHARNPDPKCVHIRLGSMVIMVILESRAMRKPEIVHLSKTTYTSYCAIPIMEGKSCQEKQKDRKKLPRLL